jgi:hypothetical protein
MLKDPGNCKCTKSAFKTSSKRKRLSMNNILKLVKPTSVFPIILLLLI